MKHYKIIIKMQVLGYMGAFGIVQSTYELLTTANSVCDRINDLIKKNELTKKDRLNFKALERRLTAMQQPLNSLLVIKQNMEIEQKKIEDARSRQRNSNKSANQSLASSYQVEKKSSLQVSRVDPDEDDQKYQISIDNQMQ